MPASSKLTILAASVLALGGAAAVALKLYPPKSAEEKRMEMIEEIASGPEEDREKVHFFTFTSFPLGPSLSPFCEKLEAFMRLAQIPYKRHVCNSPMMSPTGRLPLIIHNGQCIADSELIIEYLTGAFQVGMDASLTKEQRATAQAVRVALDYAILPAIERTIYCENPRPYITFAVEGIKLPQFLTPVICAIVAGSLKRHFRITGLGAYSREQYEELLNRNVEALIGMLDNNDYLLGTPAPTSVDCAVYGALQPLFRLYHLCPPPPPLPKRHRVNDAGEEIPDEFEDDVDDDQVPPLLSEVMDRFLSNPKMNAYIDRITALAFPDMEELLCPRDTAPVVTDEDDAN